MAHPYPPRSVHLPYIGQQHYFLTFCTDQRSRFFVQEAPVALVRAQILRAAREIGFEISAYCFMPDHLHLVVSGLDESSDAKAFISRSKQYSGYYFKREHGVHLWQRYGFERVPFLGSERYTLPELLLMCAYGRCAE